MEEIKEFTKHYKIDYDRNVFIKPYERGKTLKDKLIYIITRSGVDTVTLARVLGITPDDISNCMIDDITPDKLVISAINKLFRIWYEKDHYEDL